MRVVQGEGRRNEEATGKSVTNGHRKVRTQARLDDVTRAPGGEGFADKIRFFVDSQENDLGATPGSLELSGSLQATENGHGNIHHQHVRLEASSRVQGSLPVAGGADDFELRLQQVGNMVQHGFMVVGHQHSNSAQEYLLPPRQGVERVHYGALAGGFILETFTAHLLSELTVLGFSFLLGRNQALLDGVLDQLSASF